MKRRSTRCSAALGASLVLLRACPLFAEPEGDAERARALFKDGRALAASGSYAEACPKFEQSLKLDVGIGTKFNLADCYEHLGRTATARTLFLEVAATAHESGQSEREEAATARAKALETQIHTLVIDVKVSSPKQEIRRDGIVLEPAKWGAPEPVDPGFHEIVVTAPGKKRWHARVEVPLSGDVTVQIPALEDAEPAPSAVAAPAAVAPAKKPAPPEPPPPEDRPAATDNTVPIILYGGVARRASTAHRATSTATAI